MIKPGGNVLNAEKGLTKGPLLLNLSRKARKKRRRPALVVQVLDQSQRLQNLREIEWERGRKVAVAEKSVSTMVRRAIGIGIILST